LLLILSTIPALLTLRFYKPFFKLFRKLLADCAVKLLRKLIFDLSTSVCKLAFKSLVCFLLNLLNFFFKLFVLSLDMLDDLG
jgi:hypothetical protein